MLKYSLPVPILKTKINLLVLIYDENCSSPFENTCYTLEAVPSFLIHNQTVSDHFLFRYHRQLKKRNKKLYTLKVRIMPRQISNNFLMSNGYNINQGSKGI